MSETRRFSVDPDFVHSIIVGQAGSLCKAVLECVMNSIDANATRIDIALDATSICIKDDGQGFQSRAEIENWFEVFGFRHVTGDRVYGQYAIGRGQLWAFCSTIWRTGTFEMDVDVKRRGIEYELTVDLEKAEGVEIVGKFYDRQLVSELAAFERELAELALYAQIPVLLNGKRINKDPSQEKWDHETPDAWIRTTDRGLLAVYNLGVLVCRYPGYQFGSGGVVVTKPGVPLAVNMARNEVLVSQCQVWKRIRKHLQVKSDERIRTKCTRMTEVELENMARRFVVGELSYKDIENTKLVTDIVGRGHTIASLVRGSYPQLPLTSIEIGSQMGERAHTRRLAFVLSQKTLQRFGVENVKGFQLALVQGLSQSVGWLAQAASQLNVIEDLREAVPTLRDGHEVLKGSELSKPDQAAHQTLELMSYYIWRALTEDGMISTQNKRRAVFIGASDVAAAWTDGFSKLVVERRQLSLMSEGIGGFVGLSNILVHEYLHDTSDVGSHTHDQEFYARYHDATCAINGVLNQAVFRGLHNWVRTLNSLKLRVSKVAVKHLDHAEQVIWEPKFSHD